MGHGRQQARKAGCQHRLTRTRRANHQHAMVTSSRYFEHTTRHSVAFYIFKVSYAYWRRLHVGF